MTRVLTALEDQATPLLRRRVGVLFKHLPRALAGEEEPIHQMRVAGRRLRVGLPILAKRPEGKRVLRAVRVVRQLVRTAGTSRDLDVSLALFDRSAQRRADDGPELKTLRSRLKAARARSWRRMAENLLDLELAGMRRDLRAAISRKADEPFTILIRLRRARDVEGAMLLAEIESLAGEYEPVALHRLRRRARTLRYIAEMNAELRNEPSDATKRLKGLQERLGAIHDAHVLSEWFAGQALAAEKKGEASMTAEARRWQAHFMKLSRDEHRAFIGEDPSGVVMRALAAIGRSVIATSA